MIKRMSRRSVFLKKWNVKQIFWGKQGYPNGKVKRGEVGLRQGKNLFFHNGLSMKNLLFNVAIWSVRLFQPK